MRSKDLEDLVLPLISVDEFESKINDDAMVFGFYVNDHDAAFDLNRFIQKSPGAIIDTEVSPAPDQRGYYVVFFEILTNAKVAGIVAQIIDEVSPLVNIDNWQMQVRGQDDLIDFSEEKLAKYVEHVVNKPKSREEKKKTEGHVLSFLHASGLSGVRMEGRDLIFEGFGTRMAFEIVDFGDADRIIENRFHGEAMSMVMSDIARVIRVERMLGEGWNVTRIGDLNLLERDDQDDVLVLRDR
jgi:hypothetical protein